MKGTTLRISALAFLFSASLPALAVTSTFDTDAEGWSAQGDIEGPLTWSATGGNPGGNVFIDDLTTGGVTYFVAPSQFLGNFAGAFGSQLTFDLMQRYPGIKPLTVGFTSIVYKFTQGIGTTLTAKLSKPSSDPVTVDFKTTFGSAIVDRDYTPVSGTLTFAPNTTQQSFSITTFDNQKYQGSRGVQVELSNPTGGLALGIPPITRLTSVDDEAYDSTLLADFESYPYLWTVDKKAAASIPEIAAGTALALPGQVLYEHVLQTVQKNGKGTYNFSRNFAIGQDWSASDGVSFWYYRRNTKKDIIISLDNNPAISDPSTWSLVWSDEFNGRPGTAPNANVWGQEVGDGTANGIAGWGNSELEYYTAGANNAATDGLGNLNITVKEADGSLMCYYGPCEYTSARLLTKNRFEV